MINVTKLVEDFLDTWPFADFGPAHIVLGDDNYDDSNILWCIKLLRHILYNDKADQEIVDLARDIDYKKEHSDEELRATLEFLTQLLMVPENERFEAWDAAPKVEMTPAEIEAHLKELVNDVIDCGDPHHLDEALNQLTTFWFKHIDRVKWAVWHGEDPMQNDVIRMMPMPSYDVPENE
jgi:hypothetical protein